MNDFTKDELKIIAINLCCNEHTLELLNKINSMIDNYKCSHESDGLIYTSNPPQNKCKLCGQFYR